MTALLLLMPQTPMLFQGQEFASSSTFHYFADHEPELSAMVCKGRAAELSQFPSIAVPEMQACLPNPEIEETFRRCKLDHSERERGAHAEAWAMHKDLLRLRREDPIFKRVQRRGDVDGAVLGPQAFLLRYFGADKPGGEEDRLIIVNLGADLPLRPAPEPLLAPPYRARWSIVWSSEDVRYGGSGTPAPDTEEEGWLLPGRCTIVLRALPAAEALVETRVKRTGASGAAASQDPGQP